VPVRLMIDPEENAHRTPERRVQMKSIDPAEPFRLAALGEPYDHGHANTLTINVTKKPPDDAALEILMHAAALSLDQPPLA